MRLFLPLTKLNVVAVPFLVLTFLLLGCEDQELLNPTNSAEIVAQVASKSLLSAPASLATSNAIDATYSKIVAQSDHNFTEGGKEENALLHEALADANIAIQGMNLEIDPSDFQAMIEEYKAFDFNSAIGALAYDYSQEELNVYTSIHNINLQNGDLQEYIDETRTAIDADIISLSSEEKDRILPLLSVVETILVTSNSKSKKSCRDDIVGSAVAGSLWGAIGGLVRGCTAGWIGGPGGAAAGCIVGFVGGAVVGAATGAAQGAIACHIMK